MSKKIIMKVQGGQYKTRLSDGISSKLESGYLIVSNKEKCTNLISNSELNDNNIVDVLIGMHIVLEVSLNTLYRHLISSVIKKDVDDFKIMKNIDSVSFIDKTILFIYNSKFNFGDKLSKASEYHKIIETMRDFSGVRNKLLHGHSISTIFDGQKNRDSEAKKMLNPDFLREQIKKFCFIMKGMRFYIDCLDSELTPAGKEQYKKSFLDDSFLPILRT